MKEAKESNDASEANIITDFTKTRSSLLNILTERTIDINAFCRCKALKGLSMLVEEQLITDAETFNKITTIAVGRVADKAALSRKNAILLLIALLENNPFGSNLSLSPIHERISTIKQWFVDHPLPEELLVSTLILCMY